MENRRKRELAEAGHKIYLSSYELHDAACAKGKQMNSKNKVSQDEWDAEDFNDVCLGCSAYVTGLDLMQRLLSLKELGQMIGA